MTSYNDLYSVKYLSYHINQGLQRSVEERKWRMPVDSASVTYAQWYILVFWSADVIGNRCGEGGEGRQSALLRGESCLKQGPKQGLLAHFEQIVKCGHWISPICTLSKLKNQSVI